MNRNSLQIILKVKQSPGKVFNAIKDVKSWWIGEIEGRYDKVGAEFRYSYKTFHDTSQKVIELMPEKKVVWEVTKSMISFVKEKNEWLGTKIIFEIKPLKDGSEIVFTHEGLTPEIECYKNCSSGWDFYINKSLKNFIEKGQGINPKF